MSASQVAPSPFAALLRRSKFVTYDPAIGQVYTTHGGHAFRGDWGLKRPLPNRRRTGFITVRSVDSPEQQTEWHSAESSARWMRRWEELGKKLEVTDMGPWRSRINPGTWRVDTEFDTTRKRVPIKVAAPDLEGDQLDAATQKLSEAEDDQLAEHDSIPNPDAMGPKQFKKYLEHLRALRPEFKEFLKAYAQELQDKKKSGLRQLRSEQARLLFTGSGDVHMFHSARNAPEKFVTEFLKRRANAELKAPTSTQVKQRPHPLAGLEYTQMSVLQSKYLHNAALGRNIGTNRAMRFEHGDVKSKHDLVAVGGIIGSTPSGKHNIISTDFGTRETPRIDRERGKALFRMSKVMLQNAPQTVGRKPQKAIDAKLTGIEFLPIQTSNLSNPHMLGSAKYVDQVGETVTGKTGRNHHPIPSRVFSMVRHVSPPVVTQERNSKSLLEKLSDMVQRKEGDGQR